MGEGREEGREEGRGMRRREKRRRGEEGKREICIRLWLYEHPH